MGGQRTDGPRYSGWQEMNHSGFSRLSSVIGQSEIKRNLRTPEVDAENIYEA
jgi:hypothetical protein